MIGTTATESIAVARKKVLLGLLCAREVDRLGLLIEPDKVEAMAASFRDVYHLRPESRFHAWLQATGLTKADFERLMRRFVEVTRVEEAHAALIDRELEDHLRVNSARARQAGASEWLEVEVALSRQPSARVNARRLFQQLEPLIAGYGFYFVRKPPDLRLRFRGRRIEARLRARLEGLLARVRTDGLILGHAVTIYEPEARQFGGIEAMRHVHRYFEADSRGWIALDRLYEESAGTVSGEDAEVMVSLAVLNDLFWQTLGCGAEVWDTWLNLVELTKSESLAPGVWRAPELVELIALSDDPRRQVLESYAKANGRLAKGLLRLRRGGRLSCGLRAILPFVAMFHLNRYGVAGPQQCALARVMAEAWNPKQWLRC